jgi:hypothetical protein
VAVGIIEDIWPEVSNPELFSEFWEPSNYEISSAKQFVKSLKEGDGLIHYVHVGHDSNKVVIAFRQKTKLGRLHQVSPDEIKKVIGLWKAGPPKMMLYGNFKLQSTIHICTTTTCFPCWSWGTKGGCYHIDALREFLKLPSLRDPAVVNVKRVLCL